MRRIVTATATTITVLVLLFSYHTSTNSGGLAASSAIGSAPAGGTATSDTTTTGDTTTSGSTTFAGVTAPTRWGAVQVEITVAEGRITGSRTLVVPSGNQRDVEINDVAVPILNGEVVDAQSADIDTVSGATVTSDGYVESLQSAIDRAGL